MIGPGSCPCNSMSVMVVGQSVLSEEQPQAMSTGRACLSHSIC